MRARHSTTRWAALCATLVAGCIAALFAGSAALAASVPPSATVDGITATLSTDKASYTAGETAIVTVNLTNSNSQTVSDVFVAVGLPDSLEAQSPTEIGMFDLAAGESIDATRVEALAKAAAPVDPADPVDPQAPATPSTPQAGGIPKTGDALGGAGLLALGLALGCGAALCGARAAQLAGAGVAGSARKPLAGAVVLAVSAACACALAVPAANASSLHKTILLACDVQVNGVTEEVTATISYSPLDGYLFTAQGGEGGSVQVECDGEVNPASVPAGSEVTVTYAPEEHFHVASITVNETPFGEFNPQGGTLTFAGVNESYNIVVTYELDRYYVTGSVATEGGSISVQYDEQTDPESVPYGATVEVTYTPDEGYHLASVKVDGAYVTDPAYEQGYTFEDVAANHAVEVAFEIDTFSIDASCSIGGYVEYDTEVPYGFDASVTYTPEEGFHVLSVTIDGEDWPDFNPLGDTFVFGDVIENHTFHVVFDGN